MIALTIAGSDSSGGAGIQADLKTFSTFDVWGVSVVTAVTAQNSKVIKAIHQVPADIVVAQMDAVFDDLDVSAVKIGMLGQRSVIEAVASGLARRRPRFVVLDPVMVATTGADLLARTDLDALLRLLVPLADLVTPNLMEAAAMTGEAIAKDEGAVLRQAAAIRQMGAKAVLIKGGHGVGPDSVDVLLHGAGITRFARPRVATPDVHGTGCLLSSAIAANVARGKSLFDAIDVAKNYVTDVILASLLTTGSLDPSATNNRRP